MSEPQLVCNATLVVSVGLLPGTVVTAKEYFTGEHGGGIGAENIQTADAIMINVAAVKAGLCRECRFVAGCPGGIEDMLIKTAVGVGQVTHLFSEQDLPGPGVNRQVLQSNHLSDRVVRSGCRRVWD